MDATTVFDAAAQLGSILAIEHKMRQRIDQIESVTSRICGNCGYWMTSHCVQEKKHGRFCACASVACDDFIITESAARMAERFERERAELQGKLDEIIVAKKTP